MSLNDTQILQLYREFESTQQSRPTNLFSISPKQQNYLNVLHQQSTLKDLQLFAAFTQLLNVPIQNWSDLNSKQVSRLINRLLPEHILTKNQQTLYTKRLMRPRTRVRFHVRDIILQATPNYEYGYQIKVDQPKFYYLRFYQLAMLDFDGITLDQLEARIIKYGLNNPNKGPLTVRIYQTYNGFHLFVVSEPMHYRDIRVHQLMRDLQVDPWYLIFVQHHGFKVRLNPKANRAEPFVAKYLKTIGTDAIDPYCWQLMQIHDSFIKKFESSISS